MVVALVDRADVVTRARGGSHDYYENSGERNLHAGHPLETEPQNP